MTKNFSKILIGCAAVMAIGAVGIIGNGFLVSSAMAADNHQTAPTVTADTASAQTSEQKENEITSGTGGQVLVIHPTDDQWINTLKKDCGKATFVAGTPGANDIAKEKAISIAKSAIVKKYALSKDTLSKFTISANLNVIDADHPIWTIGFTPTNQSDFSNIGVYLAELNSHSGDVIKLSSAADAVG